MSENKKHERPTPPFPAGEMPRLVKGFEEEESREDSRPAPPAPPKPENSRAPAPQPPQRREPPAAPPKTKYPPQPPRQETSHEAAASSVPLFVKVDKYQNIVDNIQKLKSYSLGLRDAIDALADMEKELQQGISILNRSLDNFNNILGLLDSKLLRIQGIEKATVQAPKEVDEYVRNVYDQMEKIKRDLDSI